MTEKKEKAVMISGAMFHVMELQLQEALNDLEHVQASETYAEALAHAEDAETPIANALEAVQKVLGKMQEIDKEAKNNERRN